MHVTGGQLPAAGVDLGTGITHAQHRSHQRLAHRFDGGIQAVKLLTYGHRQSVGQIPGSHVFKLGDRGGERLQEHMTQCQPGQHNNPGGQQRGDDNQHHYPVFTGLHRRHFGFTAAVAPGLEGLHVVIKLTCHRHQMVFQQIVIGIRALLF